MKKQHLLVALSSLLILLLLAGCSGGLFAAPTPTPTNTPVPTSTPLPTATPTATPLPYYVTATVISGDIQAPILLYHRWANDSRENDSTHVTYSNFKAQLPKTLRRRLQPGLIEFLVGRHFHRSGGKEPLVFTVDDRLVLPINCISTMTVLLRILRLGLLYQFSKDHPDFGFAASDQRQHGRQRLRRLARRGLVFRQRWRCLEKPNWPIPWLAIENNIEIFNHTYTHADLSITDPQILNIN